MLPTTQAANSTAVRNDGYQVLNISNVNSQNEVVLNDESLLALIQQYPFLYNPHVRPHNDAHYDAWAWEQITKAFNRGYEGHNVWYSSDELIHRWKVLQPIVRSLSKINNMKSLPDTLRQTVVKMSVPMDEKVNEPQKKPLTFAQQTLFDYEKLVNSLSLADRRRLEAEMMELILNSELESKATIKLGYNEVQAIEKDYNEFLKTIGLDELYLDDQRTVETPTQKEASLQNDTNDPNLVIANSEIKLFIGSNDINIEKDTDSVTSISTIQADEIEENLLEPLVNPKWVPLERWRDYVRKCRVRIKRTVMEEDIPLAVIKREKIDKNYILPD